MEEVSADSRFVIQRRLGAGSFGVVYEAYDRQRDSPVAIKTLSHADAGSLYRFKREFRALAGITHPNLVTLYELMSSGGEWFFTMELIDGVSFLDYVRQDGGHVGQPADATATLTLNAPIEVAETAVSVMGPRNALPKSRVEFETLRRALKQLAEGVFFLHQAGVLHRDLKPSNVLVTREGRVVILDFGLVTELTAEQPDGSLAIVGTPAYMSPEQAAGQPLSPASDWYCVGTMLFQALTGQLPFQGSMLDQLFGKQTRKAPSPGSFATGLPPDLEKLCMNLLERDPLQRRTGLEILDSLGQCPTEARIPDPPKSAHVLFGRDRHMAALAEAFAVSKNQAVTLYVYGASGIGKSTLVHHFLDNLKGREPNVVVLEGRCYEQESVPYKALDSLLDSLSRYLAGLSPEEAAALMPRDVLALARVFPVLRQVEAVTATGPARDVPDSQEFRRVAFGALRELLLRLTSRVPVVLFIDDLQWGDVDSAYLLDDLFRGSHAPSLLLIGCCRSEEAPTSPLLQTLHSLWDSGGQPTHVREIYVGELSLSDATDLALSLLGNERAPSNRADALAREAGGNPYFLTELVLYLRTQSGRERTETTLDEVIQARVAQLPANARLLLEIVSVAGRPLQQAVLRRAASLHAEAAVALASLRAMKLVRTAGASGGEAVEPYHDGIRETIVARLSPTAFAAHHRCLARELEAAGNADAEQLALHFRGAREFEKAARYSLAAAEQASELLAFDRAARLYQSAKELRSWEGPELQTLLRKLARALANAGLGQRAARAYLMAAEAAPSESLELQRRAAEQLLFSGHIDEGLNVLRSVLRSIGMKLAETPRAALLSLFIRRATIRLRGLRFRERSESAIGKEELTRIDACWSVSVGLSLVDPIRAKDFQTRYLLLALRAGDPSRIALAMALEVGYSATSGGRRRRRTRNLIGATFALLEHVRDPRARALGTLMNGVAVYLEGRWKEAREHLERAEQMFREHCTGVAWEMDTAQVFWLVSVSWLGEWKELTHRSRELLKRAQERGDLYAETYVRVRLSSVALAEDQPEAARGEIRQAMSQWSQQGFHLPHFWAVVSEVHADLYCGEAGRAWTRVSENWPAISGSLVLQVQLVLINALSIRGRAALAAAAQETAPALRKEILKAADHDAGKIERQGMPWSNPLAQLMRAGAAATRGDAAKALDLLAAAEEGFAAADMALHVAVTRRRRGQLMAGDEGRQMVAAADTWMSTQDIREPSRIADVFAPGGWNINADMKFN